MYHNTTRNHTSALSGGQSSKLQSAGIFGRTDSRPHHHALQQALAASPHQVAQLQLKHAVDESDHSKKVAQLQDSINQKTTAASHPKENKTGLPDGLKSGVEKLSGLAMDDVKVHYNSSKPDQLNAHAYAQGTNIYMAPGQEKHLPHEAWHIVQQKQGRVKPTRQMKGMTLINDDDGLEREADVMGEKARKLAQRISVSPGSGQTANLKPVESAANAQGFPAQRIMKKLGWNKEKFMKAQRAIVFLYAELDGEPVGDTGIFTSTSDGLHAEENLLKYLRDNNIDVSGKNLTIYLSTSPCSSTFCTKKGSEDSSGTGCQEHLEKFQSSHSSCRMEVMADHLYQPRDLGMMEASEGYGMGMSSYSSASVSTIPIKFSKMPKKYTVKSMMTDKSVAQL